MSRADQERRGLEGTGSVGDLNREGKGDRRSMGCRISPQYSANGRAVPMGKELTGTVARKGNMSQIRQAGQLMPISLRGISNKASSYKHRQMVLAGVG